MGAKTSWSKLCGVASGSTTIAYELVDTAASHGSTVCLLPSTGRGPQDFSALATQLSQRGIRVICPWPRGIGKSDGDTDHVTFLDYAADVAAVLQDVPSTGGPVIVAGHAFGCWIARCLAERHPGLVDGLALLAAAAGDWPQELSDAINTAKSDTAPAADRLAALRLAFFDKASDPSAWLEGWFPALAAQQRAARGRTDQGAWWRSGSVPVLDVIGLSDPFRPEPTYTYYQEALGPRVEVQKVTGASHALPYEKPKESAEILTEWIGRLG